MSECERRKRSRSRRSAHASERSALNGTSTSSSNNSSRRPKVPETDIGRAASTDLHCARLLPPERGTASQSRHPRKSSPPLFPRPRFPPRPLPHPRSRRHPRSSSRNCRRSHHRRHIRHCQPDTRRCLLVTEKQLKNRRSSTKRRRRHHHPLYVPLRTRSSPSWRRRCHCAIRTPHPPSSPRPTRQLFPWRLTSEPKKWTLLPPAAANFCYLPRLRRHLFHFVFLLCLSPPPLLSSSDPQHPSSIPRPRTKPNPCPNAQTSQLC